MAKILYASGAVSKSKKMSFKAMQKAVGGYVEVVRIPDSDKLLLVNEDGISMQLLVNLNASYLAGQPIVGDAVLINRNEIH